MALKLSRAVLLSLVAQAVEVYRQESFGYLFVSKRGDDEQVEGALSYQTARRNGFYEVEDSARAEKVFKWVSQVSGRLKVYDGWHSHPASNRVRLDAKPTEEDIRNMTIGHCELIVALQKTIRYYNKPWCKSGMGLASSVGGYHFLVRSWRKISPDNIIELKLKIM